MLDIKVETFLCACKYMNFTRAAEELHITQSAVSQQIKTLEEYYNVKLFTYEKKKLALTQEGTELRKYMEAMYHDTLRIKEQLKLHNKTYKIGTTMSVGDFLMPNYFAQFMKNNPTAQLDVTRLDTKQILNLLDLGILDFAFVEGYVNKEKYSTLSIKKDDLILVCGKDYKLGKIETFEDIFKKPFLIREDGSGTRELFIEFLRKSGYSIENFKRLSTFNSPLIIKDLIKQNCGLSVIYKTVVLNDLNTGDIKEIEIPSFSLQHEYSAVWKKEGIYNEYYERVIKEIIS